MGFSGLVFFHKPTLPEKPYFFILCLAKVLFYESVFPTETGLMSRDGYGGLVNRSVFSQTLPKGLTVWKDLGLLRNRVDHPIDAKTGTHSRKIDYKEMYDIFKRLKVALAELFEVWEKPSSLSLT
jgi:hypothetical protein